MAGTQLSSTVSPQTFASSCDVEMLGVIAIILGLNALFFVPAVLLLRHANALQSLRDKCRCCGYDIRANPLRCAECGSSKPLLDSDALDRRFQALQALAAIIMAIPLCVDSLFVFPLAGIWLEQVAAG